MAKMDKPYGLSPLTGKPLYPAAPYFYDFKPREIEFTMKFEKYQQDMFNALFGIKKVPPLPPAEAPYFEELTDTATGLFGLPRVNVNCRPHRRPSMYAQKRNDAFTNGQTEWRHWRFGSDHPRKAVPEQIQISYEVGSDPRWHPTTVAHEVSHVLMAKEANWIVPEDNYAAHNATFYRAFERTVLALGLDNLDMRHMLQFEHSYSMRADSQHFIRGWANRLGWNFDPDLAWPGGHIELIDVYTALMTPYVARKWWKFW